MKSIIISGITGFVGGNLKKYVSDSYKCIGVSRKRNTQENVFSYKDISSEKLDNCFAFIHLAGKAHDLKKTPVEEAYFKANTTLTKTLFDCFLKSKCEVFIYMSSVKAVADSVTGFLTEEETPNPISAYGKSKLAAENYILSKKIPAGKRIYILRPCMIHGANNKGNLNLLYSFVAKGIPYPFGKYENRRSFVTVENLCFIISKLIKGNTIASGVYNIADDASISTNNLVKIIGETINKPARILNTPKIIVNFIAKIGDIIPIPINSERVQKLTENYEVSNTKIKKALAEDLPLSTKEGLQKTIASF